MQSEFDDPFEQDSGGTVFRDVVLLALIGFVAMVIMVLPHINPPKTENTADHRAPGNVIVELHWPNNLAYDIDLWVQAPKDVPVGFWNSTGRVFSLLRDDLGMVGDATERNYEVAYSKGIPAGEYIVNVHLYGRIPPRTEIPITVVTSVKKAVGESSKQILTRSMILRTHNAERTVYSFALTSDAELEPDSVTTLRKRLITIE
jgi:hypothetical protein